MTSADPLIHRLNNQLGVILAYAELLESRAATEAERARAAQIVASALDATRTVRALRERRDPVPASRSRQYIGTRS